MYICLFYFCVLNFCLKYLFVFAFFAQFFLIYFLGFLNFCQNFLLLLQNIHFKNTHPKKAFSKHFCFKITLLKNTFLENINVIDLI